MKETFGQISWPNSQAKMQRLENFVNGLADSNWSWWPVLSLRPRIDRDIDNMVLVRMTCVFGPMSGLLSSIMVVLLTKAMTVSLFVLLLMLACITFYVFCKFTVAKCWNRRARRLRALTKIL